jgi:hypothetical protein
LHCCDIKQNKKAQSKALTAMDQELKNIQTITMQLIEMREKVYAAFVKERSAASCAHAAVEEQEEDIMSGVTADLSGVAAGSHNNELNALPIVSSFSHVRVLGNLTTLN